MVFSFKRFFGKFSSNARAAFLVIALLQIALVLALLLARPNPDEGIYTTGGWLLLQGTVLYKEFFSMYSPGIYFIFAALYSVFPPDFVISRLFILAVNTCTLAVFFLLCKKMLNERTALLASFFYVIWGAFTVSWNILIEPFLMLFSVALFYALFCFLEKRKMPSLLAVGFLISGLVLLKQTMLFLSIGLLLFMLLRAKLNMRHLAAFLFSCALFPFIFLLYLIANNAFSDFVGQAILHDLQSAPLFAFKLTTAIGAVGVLAALFLFVSVPVLAMLFFFREKPEKERKKIALVLAWFILAAPTLLPVLGCCGHFAPLVPPFSIFFGLLFEAAFLRGGRFKLQGFNAMPLLRLFVILVFFASIVGPAAYLPQFFFHNDFNDLFEIAAYVKQNSSPDDRIHVTWWDEEMYFFCLRKPATRYIYQPFFGAEAQQLYELESIQSMRETKPLFVINFSRTEQPLQGEDKIYEYLRENYEVVKTQKMQKPLYKTFNYGFVLKRKQ